LKKVSIQELKEHYQEEVETLAGCLNTLHDELTSTQKRISILEIQLDEKYKTSLLSGTSHGNTTKQAMEHFREELGASYDLEDTTLPRTYRSASSPFQQPVSTVFTHNMRIVSVPEYVTIFVTQI
jgi:hypothetical protein